MWHISKNGSVFPDLLWSTILVLVKLNVCPDSMQCRSNAVFSLSSSIVVEVLLPFTTSSNLFILDLWPINLVLSLLLVIPM